MAKIQTPYGEFLKTAEGGWSSDVQDARGNSIQVLANDVEGVPNPRLLERLPTILADLPVLDRIVRDYAGLNERITKEYAISLISDCMEDTVALCPDCLTLGFRESVDDEDGEGDTVFVDFSGRDIVSWDVGH